MTEPKFFKKSNNERGAEEFKKCLPLGVQTSFVTMAPAIVTAEQLRVKPLLGDRLFDAAAEYYGENGTSGESDVLNGLVQLLQMTVVRLACWDSFAQLAVMMTDSGISNNQGDKRAYRYETDALRETLRRQGYEYMNKVLEHCTANIAELPEFEDSQYYANRKDSMIRGMADFERFISIGSDFCVFARLREWIDETEAMELEFRIGPQLHKRLSEGREEETCKPIVRGVMAFVAHWSMAEAAPFLNLLPTAQGLMVVSEESRQGGTVMNGATTEQIATFIDRHRKAAERYIGQVVTYCKRNADKFPEIEDIGSESSREHEADLIDNHGKKIFLAI